MYDISVIIPVYNVEQWLPRCMESIINQTIFNKMEVLLIDDGSTDTSGSLCDSYAEKYANIITYHKINGGVSSARNYGLQHAKGLYVAFVDSDDYLEKDFYERMLYFGKKNQADLIVGDYILVFPDGKEKRYRPYANKTVSWNQDSAIRDFLKGKDIGVNLFDKLFLRGTIGEIKFDEEIKIGEDLYFIFEFLTHVKTVWGTFIPGYYYFQREGSAMNNSFSEKYFDVMIVSERILNWSKNSRSDLSMYAEAMCVHSAYKTLERAFKSNSFEEYKIVLLPLKRKIKQYKIKDAFKYFTPKQFVGFMLMRFSKKLYLFACKLNRI